MFNPFPGLRPFEADEDHLFFGREREIDDLLRRLRSSRFVAVVGTSGSGKSSLVRSGLIPSLESGFMPGAGSAWHTAMFRPAEDPIGHLAAAVDTALVTETSAELAGASRVLLEVTLRRGSRGLVEAVGQARLPEGDNVLIIVDQFEELFRFRQSRTVPNSRDEAIGFVKLLLEATEQHDIPIYVVVTMRSDFIGDCMNFPGLPEAVNAGLNLVGRMSRDGLRAAITGPVAVAGGTVAPRLVNRVLNDLGDDHDQLPLVQHALMRTWDHWVGPRHTSGAMDIEDYEAIGTVAQALSTHAEEAYAEALAIGHGVTAERIFKALTDTYHDARGVRRPTPLSELAAVSETTEADVVRVIEIFRRPGRSFLMPPAATPLTARSIIDLSHESLMRCWQRLITWAEEERGSAAFYVRLSQAAQWFEGGSAGVWRNPELELARQWKERTQPTSAWASRYDDRFESALSFLQRSADEHTAEVATADRERRMKLRRTQIAVAVLAVFLAVAIVLSGWAWRERLRAEQNLDLARQAVEETLTAAERDATVVGTDTPQVEELRQKLLMRMQRFYVQFMGQGVRQSERDLARAHLLLGHINRMLEKGDEAEREYRASIERFSRLIGARAGSADDRQELAAAHNWLGETLRVRGRSAEAQASYDAALQVQQTLVREHANITAYKVDIARTLSNRGILRASRSENAGAEADFRESIKQLEPLVESDARARQELGRVANNLANLLSMDDRRLSDAQALYEQAIAMHAELVKRHPENREYKVELAKFNNNLAQLLHDRGDAAGAAARSERALALINELALPLPSLGIERADALTLQGIILETRDPEAAERAYGNALNLYADLQPTAAHLPAYHDRFGELLVNLATFSEQPGARESNRQLLTRGIDQYETLARGAVEAGDRRQAQFALDTLTTVMPKLPDRDRTRLSTILDQLRRTAMRQ